MTEFTWIPDQGAGLTKSPRIKSLSFGDGYEQRYADGINSTPERWNLSFSSREYTEINSIDDFLTALGGVNYFTWIPPRQSVAKKFICKEWTRNTVSGNLDTITCKFEQVFDL